MASVERPNNYRIEKALHYAVMLNQMQQTGLLDRSITDALGNADLSNILILSSEIKMALETLRGSNA